MNFKNTLQNTGSAVKEVATSLGGDIKKSLSRFRPQMKGKALGQGLGGALKNKMGPSTPKILGPNIGGFIKRQQDLSN